MINAAKAGLHPNALRPLADDALDRSREVGDGRVGAELSVDARIAALVTLLAEFLSVLIDRIDPASDEGAAEGDATEGDEAGGGAAEGGEIGGDPEIFAFSGVLGRGDAVRFDGDV